MASSSATPKRGRPLSISAEQLPDIKSAFFARHPQRVIAKKFGISNGTLSTILRDVLHLSARRDLPKLSRSGVPQTKEFRLARSKARFWASIDITANPDECWVWKKARMPFGHGRVHFNSIPTYAHRVAFELHNGKVPSLQVLHSCDNPPCCNPRHLREGTPLDNMRDREARYRGNNARRNIPPTVVRGIRSKLDSGISQVAISRETGIHVNIISLIKLGKTYKYPQYYP